MFYSEVSDVLKFHQAGQRLKDMILLYFQALGEEREIERGIPKKAGLLENIRV